MTPALRALSAPRRMEILRVLRWKEHTAGEIHQRFADVTFGAVSQHLRVLERAGLVRCRPEGRRRIYAADERALAPFRSWLEAMWDSALYRLKIEAELESSRRGPRPAAKKKRGRR